MSTIDEVFDKWEAAGQKMYDNRTAGDHSFTGLLAGFLFDIDQVRAAAAAGTVTVNLEDLRAVLQAADYVSYRDLVGPVDRMGDAVALATMKLAEVGEKCPYTIAHTRHWCGNENCRES